MFSLLRQLWIQKTEPVFVPRRRVSPGCKARGAFRPMLEAFEDRCLPSLITVSNLHNGGAGSLRSAILRANATARADTIQFTPGLSGTIALTSGELTVTHSVTIVGPTTRVLAVSGNHVSRVFTIAAGATVTISNLTITNGNAGAGRSAGGGILNVGALTLRNVIMTDNTCGTGGGGAVKSAGIRLNIINSKLANNSSDLGGAIRNVLASTAFIRNTTITANHAGNLDTGGGGAGIYNQGPMTIVTSTIAHNIGRGFVFIFSGGGILNTGALTILASTISGNLAQGIGGGIANTGPLSIVNSTIADNTALGGSGGGGAIVSAAPGSSLAIFNCTITGNVDANGAAGGIICGARDVTIYNTVVAENFSTGTGSPDIAGTITAGSGNFIGSGTPALTGITDGVNGNHVGTVAAPLDPKLGALENNGGPTLTRLPRPDSPLINAGMNAFVMGATDHRGARRIKFGIVDIGAVEFGSTLV